jgi:hypothetical protein
MSHNKIKVGNQSPNASGNISLAINDLSDVSISSPSNSQVIGFDGSNYINTTTDESDIIDGYLLATENTAASFVTSTYDLVSVNSKFVDTRNSALYGREETKGGLISISEFPSGAVSVANIYCQFQLASGQFWLIASTRGHFVNSSSSSVVCWMDSSYNVLGPQVILQPSSSDMRGSRKIYGYINTNTTEKVHVGFISTSGHYRRRTNRGYTIQIIKIGDYLS